jgi:tetratricopeptide (TPR) repeat protein
MRARLGTAQALIELDRVDEAIAHFQALLELNPEDNQGIRYLLLVALLERGRDDAAGKVLARYHDDVEALWRYGRLLWRFRTGGESPATRDALVDAAAANPHALEYLVDPEAMPFAPPAAFTLASREEGVYVADKLGPAFAMTGGALEWLRACARPRGPRHGSSRHRGGRR